MGVNFTNTVGDILKFPYSQKILQGTSLLCFRSSSKSSLYPAAHSAHCQYVYVIKNRLHIVRTDV